MDDLRVLLIGGPPGAGKTTLARSVGAKLGFLTTTVDDLVTAARLATDATYQPSLHLRGGVGTLLYFTQGPPQRLIDDAVVLSEFMWPILTTMIKRHAADGAPIVMDWWLFDPDRVADITSGAIKSIWLHIDPEVLGQREWNLSAFREGSSNPEQMHTNFMQRSLWRNQLILERATALGLPVLHQPGDRSVEDLTDEALTIVGRGEPGRP